MGALKKYIDKPIPRIFKWFTDENNSKKPFDVLKCEDGFLVQFPVLMFLFCIFNFLVIWNQLSQKRELDYLVRFFLKSAKDFLSSSGCDFEDDKDFESVRPPPYVHPPENLVSLFLYLFLF